MHAAGRDRDCGFANGSKQQIYKEQGTGTETGTRDGKDSGCDDDSTSLLQSHKSALFILRPSEQSSISLAFILRFSALLEDHMARSSLKPGKQTKESWWSPRPCASAFRLLTPETRLCFTSLTSPHLG